MLLYGPESFGMARPRTLWAGAVNSGSTFTATAFPGQGECWLIEGIDVYANIQPNNGELTIVLQSVGFPIAGVGTLYAVQQSQNFPGPFFWRGQVPIFHGNNLLQVEASVPFEFVIWGTETLDFTLDLSQSIP